ncbi:nuclear transport factor 2 family protein [Moritella sp. 24]|uniref:nuclear transport factor 2 family protein n=1 Tax=Moritella sp. 24 TaxID=2746230 RepID=UPI001BAB32D1|nr:nuclear transport factor 2 family protein [Moritella sp. 24]QUM76242.1 nuclear transport factor 2 family protein [Moritella sp. 24]
MVTNESIMDMFLHLENGNPQGFFVHVSDDVVWEVTGSHPLAGTYTSKQNFIAGTISKLNEVLESPLSLKLLSCITDGHSASVELVANSTTKKGTDFNNRYCWVCEFEDQVIVRVRAYLDSALVVNTLS